MSIGDSDQKVSHHWLCYGMTDNMTAQLTTSSFSEIFKIKFLLVFEFGNFKHYSEKFPADAYKTEIKLMVL